MPFNNACFGSSESGLLWGADLLAFSLHQSTRRHGLNVPQTLSTVLRGGSQQGRGHHLAAQYFEFSAFELERLTSKIFFLTAFCNKSAQSALLEALFVTFFLGRVREGHAFVCHRLLPCHIRNVKHTPLGKGPDRQIQALAWPIHTRIPVIPAWSWELDPRPHTCQADTFTLEPLPHPHSSDAC